VSPEEKISKFRSEPFRVRNFNPNPSFAEEKKPVESVSNL